MTSGQIQYIETLSLKEQFRLVEIAHETTNATIRGLAVEILGRYLASPIINTARTPTREEYEALVKP